jgi:ABC-type lipoprotein release transport system permease subunit
MGYRRTLTFGWARRDTLAVVVVALTVSFLVGATLLGVALGTQTTSIAAEYDASYAVERRPLDAADGGGTARPDAVHLTLATATVGGERVTVVGVPPDAPALTVRGREIEFPTPERGVLAIAGGEASRFDRTGAESASLPEGIVVERRGSHPVVPDTWYLAHPETVERFEPTERITIAPSDATPPTPLLSALQFFVRGTAELVRLLRLATLASGVLVGVTVYSVVRITVRERRPDIAVLRATGAAPRQVLRLYAVRALCLTAVGLAVGYGVGVILVRLVVNVAVYAGVPTSLNAQVGGGVVDVLLPGGVVLLGVGGVAGVLAAFPGATGDPAPSTAAVRTRRPTPGETNPLARLRSTRLVGWDALVPTAATLTVFVCAVLLVTAAAGAVGPLATGGGGERTITEPDAPHPIASDVPTAYVPALRAAGATVSPEILLFEVYEGDPFVARGVNVTAYRALTGIEIVEGRAPTDRDEALVGADLARSTGLSTGDAVAVGGSTAPGVARLEIVGRFVGPGIHDDQLLVGLDAARHLSTTGDGSVQFVRTRGLGDVGSTADGASTVVVTGASVETRDGRTGAVVRATNLGLSEATRTVDVSLGNRTKSVDLSAPGRRSTTAFVPFEALPAGTYTLSVADVTTSVTIDDDGRRVAALDVDVPRTVPVGGDPLIRVRRGGAPVENATVSVGDRTVRTGADGSVRVRFDAAGTYELAVEDGERRVRIPIDVVEGAPRSPVGALSIRPDAPSVFTRPTATVTLANPWATTIRTRVALSGPGVDRAWTVTLEPGATERVSVELARRPAGAYEVVAAFDGGTELSTEYAVRGDERLAVALAESGRYAGGGGVARAIRVAFGNLEVLLFAVVSLLAVTTVGSTTSSFTRAIDASRSTVGVYRATGAARRDILRFVLVDALKVGGAAALLAAAAATVLVNGLLAVGELRAYGIALEPALSPAVLLGTVVGGVALAAFSALLAAAGLLVRSPAALVVDRNIPAPSGDSRQRDE